jgi:hypothetical protein
MSSLPDPSTERAQALAESLDYLTEQDLCALCSITPLTAEAWRKRRTGPAYTLAGNRVLYPRERVREFLDSRIREQSRPSKGGL